MLYFCKRGIGYIGVVVAVSNHWFTPYLWSQRSPKGPPLWENMKLNLCKFPAFKNYDKSNYSKCKYSKCNYSNKCNLWQMWVMASVTYGKCIMANVIMASVIMAKVLMKLSPIKLSKSYSQHYPWNLWLLSMISRKIKGYRCALGGFPL